MTHFQRAVRGASFTLIVSILAAFVAYGTRIVLARSLGPTEYGLFYAVFSVVIFFLFFRDLGLGPAMVRYLTEFRLTGKTSRLKTVVLSVFTLQLGGSLLLALVLFLLADLLALYYFKDYRAALLLKVLLIYIFTSIFFTLSKYFFQGFQKIALFSSVELTKNLLVLTVFLMFWKFFPTPLAPALAYASMPVLLFLAYWPFLRKTFNFLPGPLEKVKEVSRGLIQFGLPILAADVGAQIIGYLDTLVLTYYRPLAEVGVYNVVLPSALIFLFFSKAITAVTFPLSTELWITKQTQKLARGLWLLHKYTFVLLAPIVITVIFSANFFIQLFFGQEYVSGTIPFQILLVGVLFYVMATANHSVITGIGKPKTVTLIILLSALVNALVNLLLIPRYGMAGAALATSGSYFLTFVLSTYKVGRFLAVRSPYATWLRLSFPVAGYSFLLLLLQQRLPFPPLVQLLGGIALALPVYILLLFLFNIISWPEIKSYWRQALHKDNIPLGNKI